LLLTYPTFAAHPPFACPIRDPLAATLCTPLLLPLAWTSGRCLCLCVCVCVCVCDQKIHWLLTFCPTLLLPLALPDRCLCVYMCVCPLLNLVVAPCIKARWMFVCVWMCVCVCTRMCVRACAPFAHPCCCLLLSRRQQQLLPAHA